MTIRLALFISLIIGSVIVAGAQPGNWQILQYPGAGYTYCFGINPRGDTVGVWRAAPNPQRGFLLSQGTYYLIETPGSGATSAYGINSRGDVVGDYLVGPGQFPPAGHQPAR